MVALHEKYSTRAKEYLAAAEASYEGRRFAVAYDEARTAAELASKAILSRAGLTFKKEHNVAGDLRDASLLPTGIGASSLSRLLGDASRGTYGFDTPPSRVEAKDAIATAKALFAAIGVTN